MVQLVRSSLLPNSDNKNSCVDDDSLLVIQFDVHLVNYNPPVDIAIFSEFGDLFGSQEILVTVYDAETGGIDPSKDTATNSTQKRHSYYSKSFTLVDALAMSNEGLRTCVPNDTCLVVGITYVLPSEYSVTLYSGSGFSKENIISQGERVTRIFPYLMGENTITFTKVGEACRSPCSLDQSSLEFHYWTGNVMTSPYWGVTAFEAISFGELNVNSSHTIHHEEKEQHLIQGCGYECNYPVHQLIIQTMCLDRPVTSSGEISSMNAIPGSPATNRQNTDYYDRGKNETQPCYNFFLATSRHWDPASPYAPFLRLVYDGTVLLDEISFQFVSIPLVDTHDDSDICARSFNCRNKDEEEIPFDFFLYRPYSEQALRWKLVDKRRLLETDNSVLLRSFLSPSQVLNVTDVALYNEYPIGGDDDWSLGEKSTSSSSDGDDDDDSINTGCRHYRRRRFRGHRYNYDNDVQNSVGTRIVRKSLPLHIRKCIPAERAMCIEFKLSLDNENQTQPNTTVNETISSSNHLSFESSPYQLRLGGVTYRHSYYLLGDGNENRGINPFTGTVWNPQSETTLLGKSCGSLMLSSPHTTTSNNKTDINTTSETNMTLNQTICDPQTESLFELEFHTILGNLTWIADHTHFFDFELVGGFWKAFWDRNYYVRGVEYFGENVLFDEPYSVVRCVPKQDCLGFEVGIDDGDGFPIIDSAYDVSRDGVFLTPSSQSGLMWMTLFGCDKTNYDSGVQSVLGSHYAVLMIVATVLILTARIIF